MPSRRKFISSSIFTAGVAMPLLSQATQLQKPIKGNFVHVVLFWLKDGESSKDFIQSTTDFLKQVDEINHYHLGTPADTDRPVIEKSYSVCLVVTFDSKREQDIYQEHEAHKKYIADNEHRWEKVMVIDSTG